MKLLDFDFRIYDNATQSYITNSKFDFLSSSIANKLSNIEIEFYTGFKDKNNVKIYEGDIIESHGIKFVVFSYEMNLYPKAIHAADALMLGALPKNRIYCKCRIIGNIHETKEN